MRVIVGAVLEGDLYNEVSFLTPNDFTDEKNIPYRAVWSSIQSSKGSLHGIFKNHGWVYDYNSLISPYIHQSDLIEIQKRALLLIECNVHRYVSIELHNCLKMSSNESEFLFFSKLCKDWSEVYTSNKDILRHFDTIEEYCLSHVSDNLMRVIKSMTGKVEKRLSNVSMQINGRKK